MYLFPEKGEVVPTRAVDFKWEILQAWLDQVARLKSADELRVIETPNAAPKQIFVESTIFAKKKADANFSQVGKVVNGTTFQWIAPESGDYAWYVHIAVIELGTSRRVVTFWASDPMMFNIAKSVSAAPAAAAEPNKPTTPVPDPPLNDAIVRNGAVVTPPPSTVQPVSGQPVSVTLAGATTWQMVLLVGAIFGVLYAMTKERMGPHV